MLGKGGNNGGIGLVDGIIGVTSYSSGFGDGFAGSTSSGGGGGGVITSSATSNNNLDIDRLLATSTGTSSTIADSIINFSPVKDAELRRRARNNAILAKIQELEDNASVQAAKSNRLRMMREEYESLVRKYASSKKWTWGQGSSWNENNGHQQTTYLASHNNSPQQQPFIFAQGTQQQLLLTTAISDNGHFGAHPPPPPSTLQQHGANANSNINRSCTTTGVNTEITGPVRPASANGSEYYYDGIVDGSFKRSMAATNGACLEKRRVKVVVDASSQTETEENRDRVEPKALALSSLSSSTRPDSDGKQANQNVIVTTMTGNNERHEGDGFPISTSNGRAVNYLENKKDSPKTEMLLTMMLEDEDDESLLEAHSRKKLQLTRIQQPKGTWAVAEAQVRSNDPLSNISSTSVSIPVEATNPIPTSNTIGEALKHSQQQQQQQFKKKDSEKSGKRSKKRNEIDEDEIESDHNRKFKEETSDTTTSLANDLQRTGGGGDKRLKSFSGTSRYYEITDPSISESFSMVQKQQYASRRKKLMEELHTATSMRSRRKDDDDEDCQNDNTLNDSPASTISVTTSKFGEVANKSGMKKHHQNERNEQKSNSIGEDKTGVDNDVENEMGQQCSSLTTGGGATSESIGDSLMDSIQKTPDALPRDELELHGTVKANGGEQEQEEIELDMDRKGISIVEEGAGFGSGDNFADKASHGSINVTKTERGIKELVAHRHHHDDEEENEINDAVEIRSNNLSSASQLDVLVEEENFGFNHANNNPDPGEVTKTTIADVSWFLQTNNDNRTEAMQSDGNVQPRAGKENVLSLENVAFSTETTGQRNTQKNNTVIDSTTSVPDGEPFSFTPLFDQQKLSRNEPGQGDGVWNNKDATSLVKTMDGDGNKGSALEHDNALSSETNEEGAPLLKSSSAPQTVNRNNQQQTVTKDERSVAPGGSVEDLTLPERLTFPPTSVITTNNETTEKGENPPTVKTAKGSSVNSMFPLSSPSLTKKGEAGLAGSPNGTKVNLTGHGNSNSSNSSSSSTKTPVRSSPGSGSPVSSKQGASHHTVPSGITGANNTAKRFRLKFNYDDSGSDSSEIELTKGNSSESNLSRGRHNQKDQRTIHATKSTGSKTQANHESIKNISNEEAGGGTEIKQQEDDDFDDFFDI